jgi:3-oxoacyl-[acyl-carrier-protein] synthase-3
MAFSSTPNFRVRGIATSVPPKRVSNSTDVPGMDPTELRKVVAMAGVEYRHVSDGTITATDLCRHSCHQLLAEIGWSAESVDALILITQTPDYFLPSSSCIVHRDLGFPASTAAFDVGLGCSGYPYGLWLGGMMLTSGLSRVLVLHGETPSLFCHPDDHSTFLLFGDAGSATALERGSDDDVAHFSLLSDGRGYADLIVRGRGFREQYPEGARENFLFMDGANIFAFSLKRVPSIINETLEQSGLKIEDIDRFILHQSNRFIMMHLAKKCSVDPEKMPIILDRYGNTGGPSVPLAITEGLPATGRRKEKLFSIGYGVGLSWSSAVFDLEPDTPLLHSVYPETQSEVEET